MNGLDVAILEPRAVTDIHGRFFVPAYQRGYRWGPEEVRRLLDDIEQSGPAPYYLQPIVVKSRPDGAYELVDGQQRLTTLYLLVAQLREYFPSAERRYTLEYETRLGSSTYLDSPDPTTASANIDYFHMFEAATTIEEWLAAKPDPTAAAMRMYLSLSERVKVIWYEASSAINGPALFERLNVGRIPLTDAELVKALLLARARTDGRGREHHLASQWDAVERDLRHPETWAFISGQVGETWSHIGLLLDTLAENPHQKGDRLYYTFERLRPAIDTDPEGFWAEVLDLHALVMGWFDDRELYHLVGFLVSQGMTLAELVALSRDKPKSEFQALLVDRVKERLDLTPSQLQDLRYTSQKTSTALLLMNVATVLQSNHSSEHYPFSTQAAGHWSLEHIHAQRAQALNTEDQWRTWLRLHLDSLVGLPNVDPASVEAIRARIPTNGQPLIRKLFQELERDTLHLYARAGQDLEGDVDAIDNLALLSTDQNSALNNSVFEVKRRSIIRLDKEGQFIPPCTRNAFLKYYSEVSGQHNHFWGRSDRSDYLTAMTSILSPYLKDEINE